MDRWPEIGPSGFGMSEAELRAWTWTEVRLLLLVRGDGRSTEELIHAAMAPDHSLLVVHLQCLRRLGFIAMECSNQEHRWRLTTRCRIRLLAEVIEIEWQSSESGWSRVELNRADAPDNLDVPEAEIQAGSTGLFATNPRP